MTEPARFQRLLERFSEVLLAKTAEVAEALPGRLWRIYGPEFAAPPYLPPRLFRQYVCRYVTPMIEIIHRSGGYARIHSHGRLKDILDDIAAMGADALDPIEPPPQGDVELAYVRRRYGGAARAVRQFGGGRHREHADAAICREGVAVRSTREWPARAAASCSCPRRRLTAACSRRWR